MKHTSNSGYVKLTVGEMSLDRRTVSSLLLCKSNLIYLKKTMEFRSGPILLVGRNLEQREMDGEKKINDVTYRSRAMAARVAELATVT